jgi:hypothetical protein
MSSISNMSLYIPHVFGNITKNQVAETFEKLNIGKVYYIDFVQKMGKESSYNAAYIHFEYWYDNTAARNFQERVVNPNKEARIIYDEPWYWIVLENNAKKHVSGDRKPRIILDLHEGEEEKFTTPVKNMMNRDFSEFMNAPTKKMPIAPALFNSPIAPALFNILNDPAHLDGLNDPDSFSIPLPPPLLTIDEIQMQEYDALLMKDEEQRQELAELMEEEENDDEYLISIDSRYVKELENENMILKQQLFRFIYN